MITKSYEIEKKPSLYLKYNFFLIYGENIGLKKDIKKKIVNEIKKKILILKFYLFMKMKYLKMKIIFIIQFFQVHSFLMEK